MIRLPRRFSFNSIGSKLTTAICAIIAVGFTVIVFFYASQQEKNSLLQNERAIFQVLNSVSEGLQTVMITGSADVAKLYAERLTGVKDVEDFRILRTNGLEAFHDNETIRAVNTRRKDNDFELRKKEIQKRIFSEDDPKLKHILQTQQFTYFYSTRMEEGEPVEHLTFLLPIKYVKKCNRCHGKDRPVLGVLEVTSSLDTVRASVRETWRQALLVLAVALAAVIAVAAAVLKRYIVTPIEVVSSAMTKVAKGDLTQQVPVLGRDELATMAMSFNAMIGELRASYDGFSSEHNKLSTIIMGTDEGIVVTDETGQVVLVNSAAEKQLNKTADRITREGFLSLLDDPERLERALDRFNAGQRDPEVFLYQGRFLAVYPTTIRHGGGPPLGHTAIIRDITREKQLEQMLRSLSCTDPLTGLANRRALNDTLAAEFALSAEQGRDLSVLMFDVDHFKHFNDTYGHDQGDRVLNAFAETIRECIRESLDTVCRYGGEEFIVIARETNEAGGIILAERIREAIEAMRVDGLRVATSIGVAGRRETGAGTPSELVEKADAALYRAKDSGRNRVQGATAA